MKKTSFAVCDDVLSSHLGFEADKTHYPECYLFENLWRKFYQISLSFQGLTQDLNLGRSIKVVSFTRDTNVMSDARHAAA